MFGMFNTAAPKPAGTQPPAANATQPANPAQANKPGPDNQNNAQNPDVANANPANFPPNPMDAYATLFDNANKEKPEAPPSFSLDPNKLKEISGGMSFTGGVDQELMQKAVQGDIQAFSQVMDQVARNAYSMSLQHSGALTDKFVGARSEFERKALNSEVSKQLVHNSLQVPNQDHPVVRAELRRIADHMLQTNPNANPAQIAKEAQEYFIKLSQAMGTSAQGDGSTESSASQPAEVDWDKWFSGSR